MKRAMVWFVLAAAVWASSQAAPAGEIRPEVVLGKAVDVRSGDDLVLLVGQERHTVRLLAVDAPEPDQEFGLQAKEALAKKVLGKQVKVQVSGQDRYNRKLGVVWADRACVNVTMVREGWAWHYRRYSDSKTLAKAEAEARKKKRGLWAGENPTPPWVRKPPPAGQPRAIPPGFNPDDPFGGPVASSSPDSPEEKTHWLNLSTGVRHNSSCPYFKATSKGRLCGPDEGRPCGKCGG